MKQGQLNDELDAITKKDLVGASALIEQAEAIYHKKSKTTEDKKILVANKICKVMNLTKLNDGFIDAMGHILNVDTLVDSITLFDKDYNNGRHLKDNIDKNAQVFSKKCDLVKSANALFFKDILGNESIDVHKVPLTDLQEKWFEKNKKDIFHIFKNVRCDRVDIKDQVHLALMVEKMNDNFFGKWIELIGDRKRKQVNKKQIVYYKFTLENTTYVELMLNSYGSTKIPEDLQKRCTSIKDKQCAFFELHGHSTIGEIIEHNIKAVAKAEKEAEKKDVEILEDIALHESIRSFLKHANIEFVD